MNKKTLVSALLLMGSTGIASADICKIEPGSVICGKGVVSHLAGNGMVTVDGTTVETATNINGLLKADNAEFASLQVYGSTTLTNCIINDSAEFKGSLVASKSEFKNALSIYSNASRFIHSKINQDIHMRHTSTPRQMVMLEDNSVVLGDIIFDDGEGEVVVVGKSSVAGKVVGGKITYK